MKMLKRVSADLRMRSMIFTRVLTLLLHCLPIENLLFYTFFFYLLVSRGYWRYDFYHSLVNTFYYEVYIIPIFLSDV